MSMFLKFPLDVEVRTERAEGIFGRHDWDQVIITLGGAVIYRERREADLYYDDHGDGGPSLEEVARDVVQARLTALFDRLMLP